MNPDLIELKALCERLIKQDLPPVLHNGYTLENALMAIVDDYLPQVDGYVSQPAPEQWGVAVSGGILKRRFDTKEAAELWACRNVYFPNWTAVNMSDEI